VQDELYRVFHNEHFSVVLTEDVAGVELGGALKNIVAIAAGLVDGLGYGNNTKANRLNKLAVARLMSFYEQKWK